MGLTCPRVPKAHGSAKAGSVAVGLDALHGVASGAMPRAFGFIWECLPVCVHGHMISCTPFLLTALPPADGADGIFMLIVRRSAEEYPGSTRGDTFAHPR